MVCRTALHYALFWLILASASAQLTEDQKKLIVDLHNKYRSSVDPQPANMQRMVRAEHTYNHMNTELECLL